MRFSTGSLLALLAVTSSSLAAVATRTTTTPQGINPDLSVLQNVTARNLNARAPAPAPVPMTNAQRMARGLPPKAPVRRHNKPHHPRPSSLPPTSATGYILVTKSTDADTPSGYLTNSQNSFGEYESYSTDVTQALKVSFSYDHTAPSQIEIAAINGPISQATTNAPFFGGIQGYRSSSPDLAAGSANYLFLGSVAHTSVAAVPASGTNSFTGLTGINEGTESSIWSLDPTSEALTCQWINTDGSTPPCVFAYAQNQFVVIGDLTTFQDAFGPAEVVFVSSS
ncbi:hypothetical protein FIBSPDRAFT_505086 [Athelia psychrophila]|uniref:Uncharacterized protein n=1 Tax=Athelia psychrophila TaxID=1759441 RepID=A0A165YUR4_9AGAM|nr:hypothetical protein FIBSPDRAFT_226652 [Fibularhizoctonia sp. CBS 109695]KZP21633.1 hypothetical protein FIBSPDRAFT_505086 [Fibularhizoctonia sp. CBS 109695]